MNQSELRDRILNGLNDDISDPVYFSLAQINTFIDEAIETLSEEVSEIRRTAYVPLRDGATYYTTRSIAPDVMSPYRVTLHEQDTRLLYATIDDLDAYRQRWMENTSTSPDWWFPVSWDMFGVYPAASSGSGFLRVDYLAWPAALLDSYDEPEFSLDTHDAIVLYGITEGLLAQWDVTRALDYWTEFSSLWRDRAGHNTTKRLRNTILYRMGIDQRTPADQIGNP